MKKKKTSYPLRISDDLKVRLKLYSEDQRRSMNQSIEYLLEIALALYENGKIENEIKKKKGTLPAHSVRGRGIEKIQR